MTTARLAARIEPQVIVSVAYEGPTSPYAGITAVLRKLMSSLSNETSGACILILPFHQYVTELMEGEGDTIGAFDAEYQGDPIRVQVVKVNDIFLIKPEDDRFFAGKQHPYDVPAEDLLRDSLFFGAAVARALPLIAAHLGVADSAPLGLVLHDWEAATTSLALAKCAVAHRLLLILHNVYDGAIQVGLPDEFLYDVGIDATACPGPQGSQAATVLQRTLYLQNLERTVFGVSEQFAADVTSDVYLSLVLAPQLRDQLEGRLCGNDNGLFASLQIAEETLLDCMRGDFEAIKEWKSKGRIQFIEAARQHEQSDVEPIWGDIDEFVAMSSDSVWFVTGGRDDSRQRGHDVLVEAIPDIVKRIPHAQFLFFVMPGDESLAGLQFLRELAEELPHNVIALPFRFAAGYVPALQGADWAVMPSFYGPFESANEFYLLGAVPGIARATGGLIQQIVPLRTARSYSRSVRGVVARWYDFAAEPTGILYREKDRSENERDWREINSANYGVGSGPSRIESRRELPLFRNMVQELQLAIHDAVDVRGEEARYYRMIVNGIQHLERSFSWQRNVAELLRVLDG